VKCGLIGELLPVYFSGEASVTTKALVEKLMRQEREVSSCVAGFDLLRDCARKAFAASPQLGDG